MSLLTANPFYWATLLLYRLYFKYGNKPAYFTINHIEHFPYNDQINPDEVLLFATGKTRFELIPRLQNGYREILVRCLYS